MTVYLEYAILDNFTLDFFLLFCASVTLKLPFKKRRVALGAAVGTGIALLSVYVCGVWLYILRAACLLAMCAVTVGFGKKLFWHILLTLAYTFVTGGAIVGIFNLLGVAYVAENGFFYNMPVPLFVYVIGVCAVAFLCYSLAVFVRQTREAVPYLKKVRVHLGKQVCSVLGFCDSGNTVFCRDLPVCFVTKNFGNFRQFFAERILQGKFQRVQVATLVGAQTVCAVQAELETDGICRDVFLALPAQKCQTHYELLLNGAFCADHTAV